MKIIFKKLKDKNLNKNLGSSHRYTAFTLAEVLIVIGIIGMVANMTIPTLMANIQKDQYVAALKKAYSEFNQVLSQFASSNGCVGDLKCTGLFSGSYAIVGDELVTYFNVAKNCKTNNITDCFVHAGRNYDRIPNTTTSFGGYSFITVGGIAFKIDSFGSNCATNASTSGSGAMTQLC